MRMSTYLGFAAGLAAGACLISYNPKAKQMMNDVKQKACEKMESMHEHSQEQPTTQPM